MLPVGYLTKSISFKGKAVTPHRAARLVDVAVAFVAIAVLAACGSSAFSGGNSASPSPATSSVPGR